MKVVLSIAKPASVKKADNKDILSVGMLNQIGSWNAIYDNNLKCPNILNSQKTTMKLVNYPHLLQL